MHCKRSMSLMRRVLQRRLVGVRHGHVYDTWRHGVLGSNLIDMDRRPHPITQRNGNMEFSADADSSSRGAADPWAKIASLNEETLAQLAQVLEIRAAEPSQPGLKDSVAKRPNHSNL